MSASAAEPGLSDPPTVTITSPQDGAVLVIGQDGWTQFSCTPAAGTTITSCVDQNGQESWGGGFLATDKFGHFTYSVTGVDSTGGSATATISYSVVQPPPLSTSLRCHGRVPTQIGTRRGEWIHGSPGHDVIMGLGGGDMIVTYGGNDVICGGGGDDVVVGKQGRDTIYGARGDDNLLGGSDDDRLYGGPGDDWLRGGSAQDLLYGGPGADRLHGGSDQDVVHQREGSDVLHP